MPAAYPVHRVNLSAGNRPALRVAVQAVQHPEVPFTRGGSSGQAPAAEVA